MIYNALILSHINYGLLLWGYNADRIYNLQKSIRIIELKKYNAHTEPLFKSFKLLKVADIFKLQQLKFYFNLINNKQPGYFNNFDFTQVINFTIIIPDPQIIFIPLK